MAGDNIFFEEWRECLREHYKYVIKNDDAITRQSLTKILLGADVRFSEEELQQLYIEATMRSDDYHTDTIPDPNIVATDVATITDDKSFQVHPAECMCDICSPVQADIDAILEQGHDDEGQPLPADMPPEDVEAVASGNVFAVAKPFAEADAVSAEADAVTAEADAVSDTPETDDPRQMSMF